MTPETILTLGQQALWVTFMISSPLLLSALLIGLLVGMLQAATQINEMTLSFIPKLMVLGAALMVGGPWILGTITDFTRNLFLSIPSLLG
ncbi:MAG: flagellar biosynthesis protein FliQ [Pseudomonadota bacterium]